MSDIATLELLEPYLAQVIVSDNASVPAVVVEAAPAMPNGRQGSHLEVFFSEVKFQTFVAPKRTSPKMRQSGTSNSNEGALKYNLRLH